MASKPSQLSAASVSQQVSSASQQISQQASSVSQQVSQQASSTSQHASSVSQQISQQVSSVSHQVSSVSQQMSQRASELAHELFLEPTQRPRNYLKRAIVSAWYPIKGIWFFLRNREFWPLFVSRLLPLSIISFIVYFVLFAFAFLPQFAFLAIWQGWNAWASAVVLVLGEGYVIIQGLFEGFFVDETRVDVFDAVLIKRSLKNLIAPHRILYTDAPDAVRTLGKPTGPAIYQPWSLKQMAELVIFLPLNFIPYVGVPAFIIITGARLGKLSHYRWYQLRGLTREERKLEIKSRAWEYTWFGTIAMVLELIPVLSLFFLLTTTVGAALWVADMEDRHQGQAVEALVGDGAPPPYEDDDLV